MNESVAVTDFATTTQHDAVLFDFSGTLFRLEEDDSWFTDLRVGDDEQIDGALQAELMRRMTTPVGAVVELDEDGVHAWKDRKSTRLNSSHPV